VPESSSFDYALVRVVPQVEREEFVNVGLIFFCRARKFLDVRLAPDWQRLRALAPALDADMVRAQLDVFASICAGGAEAGPIGRLTQAERFHWLTHPRSTTIQISPVHCGLCSDPQAALESLFVRLVGPPM
jgi:hypothetical protein